jgi:dihydrofolate reductase
MRKISAFTIVSLDGYFAGPDGEIDWFKNNDEEDNRFAAENANPSATLMFGHTTYGIMAGYWPTPAAVKQNPDVAATMNNARKIVFSKTLKQVKDGPVWKNVTVIHEIKREEILELKGKAGGDIVILGSGSIVRQLAGLGLIDEYQFLVNPVILGAGKFLFRDFGRMNLKLVGTRAFKSGKVFLRYQPVGKTI